MSSSYLVAKSGQQVESYLEGVARPTDIRHKAEVFSVYVEPTFIDEGEG